MSDTATPAAPEMLNARQLAARLQISLPTLARWRKEGFGPPWFIFGDLVRYSTADVDAWVAARQHRRTSEYKRGRAA